MASRGTTALVAFVQHQLSAAADPNKVPAMQAYMKTRMPFYGVQAPACRAIVKAARVEFAPTTPASYRRSVKALWDLPHREEKYLAIHLAIAWKAHVGPSALPLYEAMLREGAWWDFVDPIATHLVGSCLRAAPETTGPIMDAWIDDPHLWIRRSAIICQNRSKTATDPDRLFRYCRSRAHEKEFFIRKAIGWALRDYSRTAPQAVLEFLRAHAHCLSGLSMREGAKTLRKLGHRP